MHIYGARAHVATLVDLWESSLCAYLRCSRSLCLLELTSGKADFMHVCIAPAFFCMSMRLTLSSLGCWRQNGSQIASGDSF